MFKLFTQMKKKGISPLVATVLLIAFAVALGALVITFGQSFLKAQIDISESTTTGKIQCTQIDLEYSKVEYDIDADSDYAELNVSFRIKASEIGLEISDFGFSVRRDDGRTQDFSEVNDTWSLNTKSLVTGGYDQKKLTYHIDIDDGAENENVTEVDLYAIISVQDGTKEIPCIDNKVTLTSKSISKFTFV